MFNHATWFLANTQKVEVHVRKTCDTGDANLAERQLVPYFVILQNRVSPVHMGKNEKMVLTKSFIPSNFNYCPLVWHFCSTGRLQTASEVLREC